MEEIEYQDYDGKVISKSLFYDRIDVDKMITGNGFADKITKGDKITMKLITFEDAQKRIKTKPL